MNTCANILHNLSDYITLLKSIKSVVLSKEKQSGNSDKEIIHTVSFAYNTIKLLLHTKDQKDNYGFLYFQCVFQIKDGHGRLEEMYCANKEVENDLNNHILNTIPVLSFAWDNNSRKSDFSNEVMDYLSISDRIAQQSYLCSSGDDYYPGYFSEIIIGEEIITLKQINWHNARSIDHKQDYSMRNLEIIIPLNGQYEESKFFDHMIGNILIHFSDRSSQKNKTCGDKILQKIEEEKVKFGFGSK